MKRLKLNVEEIEVESFAATDTAGGGRGTVHGHAKATYGCTEGWAGCGGYSNGDTCAYTCQLCVETLETACQHTCNDWTCAAHDDCLGISAQGYFTCGFYSCDGTCP